MSETHLSVVVFIGDRAYKLKKPLDLGFVDLRTRESRQQICLHELALNRRLAPDVYLDVLDVVSEGQPVDHLLVMRRLPEDRRLATLVSEGDPSVSGHLVAVARQVADFHSRAERSAEIERAGRPEALLALWEDNVAGLDPYVERWLEPAVHERVAALAQGYLAGRRPLLEARIGGGHIVDGHGDLQAADIFCLDDGPRILDCIEFCDRFRHGDVVADVAFLAMDLERLGAADLALRFLDAYGEFSAERAPATLVAHYVAYRAHVRAKVNCLLADQVDGDAKAAAVAEARRLLHTTLRWLEEARVRLVLVGGPPGTGKSRLARGLGDTLGWPVLSSDEVRDELAPRRGPQQMGEGRYGFDARAEVYRHLVERARVALGQGQSVILDATWGEAEQRSWARDAARETAADLVEVVCDVDPATAEARVTRRLADGGGPDGSAGGSEATLEVAARLREQFAPWPEATVVDTAGDPGDTVGAGLAVVEQAP